MFVLSDPLKNPFNDWLKSNGLLVAISVAGIVLTIVLILFLISLKKK